MTKRFWLASLSALAFSFTVLFSLVGLATATVQQGKASWYGPGLHGRPTASGERFNMNTYSAAHRTLPFGTKLCVENLRNGRGITVRVNDRGPFVGGRVIDLSKKAAQSLGMIRTGTAPVRVSVVSSSRQIGGRC